MKVKVPKIIAMSITSLQLLQMFAGMYINLYAMWIMYISGTPADCPHRYGVGILVCVYVYFAFAFLFGKFFYDSYVAKGKNKPKKVQ